MASEPGTGRGKSLMTRVDDALGALAVLAWKRPVPTLLVLAVLTAVSAFVARNLAFDADVAGLLPKSFKSVQAVERLKERFGAVGSVAVVGMDADPEALKRFADDIAPKLEQLPTVDYVDWRRPKEFFEDRSLYFLDLPDLTEVADRIDERVQWERRMHNPMYVDLEESKAPELNFSDIERRYAKRSDRQWFERQGDQQYYLDPKSRMVLLMAKPFPDAAEIENARKVIADVENVVSTIDASSYGPDFHVELTGRYKKRVDQQEGFIADIALASALSTALMMLYLFAHFRRLAAVGLIMAPLLVGVTWMFGLTTWLFGTLNILTGFVGAILLGLGIDHGIHLLTRFEAERTSLPSASAASTIEHAVRTAFGTTGRAVLTTGLTTAAGFACVAISEFRAFREFGVIAASGSILAAISYAAMLPAMLSILERLGWRPRSAKTWRRSPYAGAILRWGPALLWAGLVPVVLLAFQSVNARFDYDFGSLEASSLPSFKLDVRTNHLLGYSQTPVVVLTKDEDEEKVASDLIRERSEELGDATTVDMVASVSDMIPADQASKHQTLERLGKTLAKIKPSWLEEEDRESLLRLKRMCAIHPFGRGDLPLDLRRHFENPRLAGENGFVLVFPAIKLNDGEKVRVMAKELRGVGMPDGSELTIAGEAMILADILEMIWSEAPPVLALAVVTIFVLMWLLLGSLAHALACLVASAGSVAVALGLASLAGVQLNYLNFIFLLVLFGMGTDAAVHLVVGTAESDDFREVLDWTGRGTAAAAITTAFSFASLLVARHNGLHSVGTLVLLGLACAWFVSIVPVAAAIALVTSRNRPGFGLANPGPANPGPANPGFANPGFANPGFANPGFANPGFANSGFANSGFANPGPPAMWAWGPAALLATWGLAGLSPVAPGTVAALFAIPLAWGLGFAPSLVGWGAIAVLTVAGTIAAGRYVQENMGAHRQAGEPDHGTPGHLVRKSPDDSHVRERLEDPREVVVDEVAGASIAIFPLGHNLLWMIVAFALFRALDILKPWPISVIQRRVHGGLGIMADDLCAGAIAAGLCLVLERFAGNL